MKSLYKYMLIGAALSLTACNDSFLDRTPTNNLTGDVFWRTTSDLESYCNGIYNQAASNGTYRFMIGFHSDAYSVKVTALTPWKQCQTTLPLWMPARLGLLP